MNHKPFSTLPPPPRRAERESAPAAPRLCMEIARLLRARMQSEEAGIMSQSTARVVMSHLAANGTMAQLDIVRATRLKPPTVSVLLRRMEEEGYVARVTDEKDRRAVRVTLTQKGDDFDREHLARLSTNDHQAVKGLSPEECATLELLLTRMRDNLTEG